MGDWAMQPSEYGTPARVIALDGSPPPVAHVYGVSLAERNERASRIVSCVNALAGVAEPEEALRAARETLAEIEELDPFTGMELGRKVTAALRALSPDNHGAARGGEEKNDG